MNRTQTIVTDFDPNGPFAELLLPPRFRKRQSETRFKQRWTLTVAQYMAMMREFRGPRKQRGIICATVAYPTAVVPGNVQIGAHSITDQRFSAGTARSDYQFQNDGELWSNREVAGNTQLNLEWWSDEPEASVGNDYECRHISSGKTGTYTTESAVANTWITITGNRTWGVTRSTQGTKACTATFEIGDDGAESADDSAVFTCTATVDFM
ncbi:MAG: hypothetical protein V3S69_01425 [Dehalococcoidales bacterium]